MIRKLFGALALTSAAVATAGAAPPAKPAPAETSAARPAAHFAALPLMEGPKLSPDGTRIAAKLAIRGEQYFAILPLAGGTPRLIPSDGKDINWWRWVNDRWLVAGIGATDKVFGTELYVSRAIGIEADAQKIVPLAFHEAAQNADDVIWIASDGSPRIRLALQKSLFIDEEGFWPEVVEVDVSNGKTKRVVDPKPGVVGWYADASGAVRMGIGYTDNGRSSRLLYRDGDGHGFKTLDRANSRKGERLLVPSLFLTEPGQALAIADKDGFDALYKLDLATLALGERVFGATGYDIDGIVTDPRDSKLLGVHVTEKAPAIRWLDPQLASAQAELDKALAPRQVSIVSFDAGRTTFILHVGGADRPGTYYVVLASDGKLRRLAHVNEHFAAGKLHPVKTIAYKARDGVDISAVLTLPAGRDARNLPVIVMPHGGPFARDAEEWDWWPQFLADRGYAVIQPNYRGSSGYGTAFAEKGEGQWGLAMQDDLNDALAHLAREGIADPARACMVGASYGGYAAMRAAQRDGKLYRCAVSFAGVSDLPALLRYDRRFLMSGRSNDWLREQAPDLKGVSPINFADAFGAPILLVHGKDDRRVPVKQSRELADKLRKAGKNVRYVEQPKGDHHFSRGEDRLQFLEELETFLKEHNPA